MISQSIFALVVLTVAYVEGTPFGSTTNACVSMAPKHPGSKPALSLNETPYRVDLQRLGNSIEVTITGQEIVQGFMLQARVNAAPAGTFAVSDTYGKLLECPDGNGIKGPNTVTHMQKNTVKSVTYIWTAPPGTSGKVQFLATVAKDYANFWVQIPSAYVEF